MIPLPWLIGAAVLGIGAYALSDDDKSKSPPAESSSRRILSENQLPRYTKHKLEEKRNRSGGAAAASDSFDQDFSRIENMLSQDEHHDVIRDALQEIAKRADTHRNAGAMMKVGLYYHEIYNYDAAQKCFERAKILARS